MHKVYIFLLLISIAACSPTEVVQSGPDSPSIIVAYVYGSSPIKAEEINAQQITHINYAFADIVNNELSGYLPYDDQNYRELQKLKQQNPDLKILISVGGWGKSNGFSDAAIRQSSRDSFVRSAMEYVEHYQIDGVDIDWEYPAQAGAGNIHRPEDKQNFTFLLRDLRAGLDSLEMVNQRDYLLTIASAAGQRYLSLTELDIAHQYLDFINIMSYDFSGSWSDTTAHHANLYPSSSGYSARMSAAQSVEWHQLAGVPKEKLVLGIPFFGREWFGVDNLGNGLHQKAVSGGGGVSFPEIMQYMDQEGYQRHWDEAAQVPYLWNPIKKAFVTYEDPQSIQAKAAFIQKEGLAGAMFWKYRSDTTQTLISALSQNLYPQ